MTHILVVDDSPTQVHLVSYILKNNDYEVLTAKDGEQALEVASAEQPALILLDIILPRVNGYEVCRQLKATPETKNIPVVMLTSKSRDKDRHWGLEQGADDYLAKPFDEQSLLTIIEKFVVAKVQE